MKKITKLQMLLFSVIVSAFTTAFCVVGNNYFMPEYNWCSLRYIVLMFSLCTIIDYFLFTIIVKKFGK